MARRFAIARLTIAMVLIATVLVVLTAPAQADPVLRWSPADGTIPVGDEITLSVMLDDTLTVRTIELYIEYDPALVTTVSGGPGALFTGFNLFQGFEEDDPQEPGVWHGYCVILGATAWATGPGELFRWTVAGDTVGICPITTVELTLLPPGGSSYPEATLPGTTLIIEDDLVSVPDATAGGAHLTVQPNPFNPTTRVSFSFGDHRAGHLAVLDARGHHVTTLWAGESQSGWATWNGTDAAGRSVPSGVYSFVLTDGAGRRATARGTLVR
jgi:hypothetical protein